MSGVFSIKGNSSAPSFFCWSPQQHRQTDGPGSVLPAARDGKFSIAKPPKQPIAMTKLKLIDKNTPKCCKTKMERSSEMM